MKKIKNKILKLEDVSQKTGVSVVLCHGHFNMIHPGHIRYLDYAHKKGEKLFVSVQGETHFHDFKSNNYFSEAERAAGVASIQTVDKVIMLGEGTLEKLIKKLKPSVLVLGKEFENERANQVSKAIQELRKFGGKILFHAGESHYASADLFSYRSTEIHVQQKKLFLRACSQQKLKMRELFECIDNFRNASLLVIGDTIIDQYVACDALGMSAEAPVVVLRELDKKEFVGGAAVVAMHVKEIGAKCHYLSVVGKDKNANIVEQQLKKANIKHVLVEDDSRPTTFKIRYMVDNQKMFRVSRLKEHSLPRQVEDQLIKEIKSAASHVKGIIVSDFVYGIITPRILESIKKFSEKHDLLVFGDLQCSSQVGDVSKFKNFNLICPTERESRVALGTQDEGIEWVANALMKKTKTRNLVMKLGGDGFIAYAAEADGFVNRQHFPALSTNPIDVTGAGDSLLAALSVGLCSGSSLMQSSAIGAGMASLVVQQVGNIPVSCQQLKNHLNNI